MPAQKLTPDEYERIASAVPCADSPRTGADASLFRQLVSMDRGLLEKLMAERSYGPGEIVFREGDQGDAMYLIRSGRVAVVKGDFAAPLVLACWGAGEVVGEMALLEEKPRSASIVALEDSRLLRISRQRFQKLLSKEPAIGMQMMETLSSRLRELDEAIIVESATGQQYAEQLSELQRERLQYVELERARQETIDVIVQDLRNLVSPIYTSLQMLQIVLPEDTLAANRELLDVAVSSCENLQRMVESLHDLAHLEAGEVRLEPVPVKLRHLVEQAVSDVTPSVERGHVLLHPIIPRDLPAVMADAALIVRVLVNLLDYAIRRTPRNEQITVSASVEEEEVVVSVTDAAPALPPEQQEHLFSQAIGGPLPQGGRSSGLELTFCRLAVEAHGGTIWVEPGAEGEGNRFAFTLPVAD
jgi:signal transduction histidine kinase